MEISYTCSSVKEFNAMLKKIRPYLFTDIELIYNIGTSQFYEYPLFIFTANHVFRIYFFFGELSLTVFDKDRFSECFDGHIFHYKSDPGDFDYINYPFPEYPDSSICDIIVQRGSGTEHNLVGLDIVFFDGTHLFIRQSDFVYDTMDSWLSK